MAQIFQKQQGRFVKNRFIYLDFLDIFRIIYINKTYFFKLLNYLDRIPTDPCHQYLYQVESITSKLYNTSPTLREKCPNTEYFWFVFSRIRTEYGEIPNISSYSVGMRENTDQKLLRIWTLFTGIISCSSQVLFVDMMQEF